MSRAARGNQDGIGGRAVIVEGVDSEHHLVRPLAIDHGGKRLEYKRSSGSALGILTSGVLDIPGVVAQREV
jgi:hypothetical protein